MKNRKLLVSLLSILTLSSCNGLIGNNTSSEVDSNGSSSTSTNSSNDATLSSDSESSLEVDSSNENSSEIESSSESESLSEVDSSSEVTSNYYFTDFTNKEKETIRSYIGMDIPFIPNNDYMVEEDKDQYGAYVNFYTFNNTEAEFKAYLKELEKTFTLDSTETDSYGDLVYYYSHGDAIIEISFYLSYGETVIDAYIYSESSSDIGGGDSGNTNDDEIMSNANKGLPTSSTGVYNVNLDSNNVKVKDVTELGDYTYGCPTTGSPAVLVVPVQFSDVLASSKGYTIEAIENAFLPKATTNATLQYQSVYDYFYESSYGNLTLDIDILDSWFTPKRESSYYNNLTFDYFGNTLQDGEQVVMNEVLAYLDNQGVDLSKYDSNNDGTIDSIVLINTLTIDETAKNTFKWAFRYWNMYLDNDDYYYYDDVSANDYLWASYQFLCETASGFKGNPTNTYTFIHEFSHVLGADDYYDTAYVNSPLDGYDIMDSSTADHSPYTKMLYGWIKQSRLIVAENQVTVDLNAFETTGDSVIIANNWDDTLGTFQEYWVVVYYNNTGLNKTPNGLFENAGVVVYHINATLAISKEYSSEEDGDYYYIINNNTDPSDSYGSENNLISFVKNGTKNVFTTGSSLSSSTKDDEGTKVAYTFVVDSIDTTKAVLTFTKNN